MKTNRRLTIIAAFCVGVAAIALAENKDELKQRILAQAQGISADDYCFTRTVRSQQTSNGKTEQKVVVEKFDPSKPAANRWALVTVDGAAPSPEAVRTFQTEASKRRIVPGYSRLAGYFGAPASVSTDSKDRTVFHFADLPKDTVKVMDTDVSENATVDASVGEANGVPFVEQVRTTLKPMRLKLLFKLDRFESTARYRLGPEGKPLLMEQVSDMSGSGMGKEGQVHTAATYGDYKAVSKQH